MSMGEKWFQEFTMHLLAQTPRYLRRLLIAGDDVLVPALFFYRRKSDAIQVLTNNHFSAEQCRAVTEAIQVGALPPALPLPQQYFDLLLLAEPERLASDWTSYSHTLHEYGHLLVFCPNPRYWRCEPVEARGPTVEEVKKHAERLGLRVQAEWRAKDAAFLAAPRDSRGNILIENRLIPAVDEEARNDLACPLAAVLLVKKGYNPVAHAQACRQQGHPDHGYEILSMDLASGRPDSEARLPVELEKLYCLRELIQQAPVENLLDILTRAQSSFYSIIAQSPLLPEAYHLQAEVWRLAGNSDMADRLERCIRQVSKTAAPVSPPRARHWADPGGDIPPEWNPAKGPHNILFVLPPRPHYGLDVLYEGLCTILDQHQVIDFPSKPFLHGEINPHFAHYLCFFNRPALDASLDQILDLLKRGAIDCILYGDCERSLDASLGRSLINAAKNIPVFLIDELDEPANMREKTREYLGNIPIAGYFKREMLACGDYGPNAFPLPFAYPDTRIPFENPMPRARALFWAGHRRAGLRALYLDYLAEKENLPFNDKFPPHEYSRVLLDTRMGLNFFGSGFDTLRFWELPAHGCLILSERLPIRIPHPFRDGKEAVFFDDVTSLSQMIHYYLDHEEEAAAIAHAGRERLLQHHTASARARQLLAWIQHLLG